MPCCTDAIVQLAAISNDPMGDRFVEPRSSTLIRLHVLPGHIDCNRLNKAFEWQALN